MPINNAINRPISNTISVSSATYLDSSALDQVILCTGASDYTVTLPSALLYAGRYIPILVNTTSNALVTMDIGASPLNPILGASESLVAYSNGSNWIPQLSLINPYFIGEAAADQVLTTGTPAPVVFGNSTAYACTFSSNIFTCIYPGMYEFSFKVELESTSAPTPFQVSLIYEGGTTVAQALKNIPISTIDGVCVASFQYQMSATDTMGVEAVQTSGVNQSIQGTVPVTYFSGKRINYF